MTPRSHGGAEPGRGGHSLINILLMPLLSFYLWQSGSFSFINTVSLKINYLSKDGTGWKDHGPENGCQERLCARNPRFTWRDREGRGGPGSQTPCLSSEGFVGELCVGGSGERRTFVPELPCLCVFEDGVYASVCPLAIVFLGWNV